MRRYIFDWPTLCLMFFVFLACQKEIGFGKIDTSYEEQLFIEGILYPGEAPRITISTSQSFFQEKVTPQEIFVRGATVEISTDKEVDLLKTDSTFDKFRCRWDLYYQGSIIVEYGRTYRLSVTYEGKTYSAATTIDQPKVNITDVTYTPEFYDVYGGHDGVIMRLRDAQGLGNNYRFQMDRMVDNTRLHAHVLDVIMNNCTDDGELFLVRDLGRTIFSDGLTDQADMELFIEVSFEYLEGDQATIYLQSLDAKSAAFFRDMDNQLQSILNPFIEPVFLHSTIEGVLGVFGSAVRSDPIYFTYPQDNP